MSLGALDNDEFRDVLLEMGRTSMPFGKYGPDHFPPSGVPIYDLPPEYLAWFAAKGFPKSRLGELLQMVHEIKSAGADEVFGPLRKRAGGRMRTAKCRPKSMDFGES